MLAMKSYSPENLSAVLMGEHKVRTTVYAAAIFWLVSASPLCGLGDDESQARRIIDNATHAIGGEERLANFKAATWQSEGTLRVGEVTSEFKSDWSIQGRTRYRKAKTSTQNGREVKSTVVLNENQAWFRREDDLFTLTDKQLEPARAEAYTHWTALRLDISETASLSLLGEMKVNGRTAVGIRVRDTDVPDVDLYFDKQTSLLARMDTHITTFRGEAAMETRVFRDYKETGGIKYASKVEWTGRSGDEGAVQTEERHGFKTHEMLDESVFAKP
jgi:hypothetical protein